MTYTMHTRQANLRENKKFSPGRLKTQKGDLGKSIYIYNNEKRKMKMKEKKREKGNKE